jgi:hypothetical protein
MTTTINADTIVGGAVVTADASGVLGLQAAGNTGITLNSSRAIGVGASPSYGTAGQALLSAGSAAAPTWGTPVGGLNFISSQTVSTAVASVDFTSGIDSTYDDYMILIENATSSAASANARFYLYQSGAFSSSYTSANMVSQSGNVITSETSVTVAFIGANTAATFATTTVWNANLLLQNVNSSTVRRIPLMGTVSAQGVAATANMLQQISSTSNTAAVVTGFRFAYSTGNVAAGTIRLYGIAKS